MHRFHRCAQQLSFNSKSHAVCKVPAALPLRASDPFVKECNVVRTLDPSVAGILEFHMIISKTLSILHTDFKCLLCIYTGRGVFQCLQPCLHAWTAS